MARVPLILAFTLALAPALALPALATSPGCTPTCTIQAATGGFVPAIVAADSGATFNWNIIIAIHSVYTDDGCFNERLANTPTISLAVTDGQLLAHSASAAHPGSDKAGVCTGAIALPNGDMAIPYHCEFHPEMHGVFIIKP